MSRLYATFVFKRMGSRPSKRTLRRLAIASIVAGSIPGAFVFADDARSDAIARLLADAIQGAIPETYDKKDDWGAAKSITVGVRASGKLFSTHITRRKKSVPHGTWKHYVIRRRPGGPEPRVRIENLRLTSDGASAFTLLVDFDFDYWARAKVYQYGIHLVALEIAGSAKVSLRIEGEVSLKFGIVGGGPGAMVDPRVNDSQLTVHEWRVDRISDLRGPLVKEMGDGVRRLVEQELNGPALTAKINRAIDKKRDRLQVQLTP